MTGTMMMDRASLMTPGMPTGMPAPAGMPTGGGMMMVPRCTMTVEKVTGGMRMVCKCDDPAAVGMVQNLCSMLAGGMVSCCCLMNGMTVCCCCLTMGTCKVEMLKDGCSVTCTSGDKACCDMIQACCDCMAACMKAGCCCCLMMNNTPVCCSTC